MSKSAKTTPGASKEKKQLIMLGALLAVLVGVLFTQGGDGSDEPLADVALQAGMADVVKPVPAVLTESSGQQPHPGNEVLSASADGLVKSPFSQFWSFASDDSDKDTGDEVLPPPRFNLNGTLTAGEHPVALIDGSMNFLGDSIGGWTIVDIGARAVTLRSPGGARHTVEMPLLELQEVRRPDR